MNSDQHDFANRIKQINEQFDRMRENVDRLALQHHKSIGSKEYVEMFQKIELGRKMYLLKIWLVMMKCKHTNHQQLRE